MRKRLRWTAECWKPSSYANTLTTTHTHTPLSELLQRYAACKTAADIISAQKEWLDKCAAEVEHRHDDDDDDGDGAAGLGAPLLPCLSSVSIHYHNN